MRTVFSNAEVCHVWASQKQEHGRGPSIFFQGPSIYSYGRHFEMARHVEHNGRSAVLFTTESYSVTTAKHKSYVLRAINHRQVFTVPLVHYATDPQFYFASYQDRFDKAIKSAARARTYREFHLNSARELANEANDMAEFFGIDNRIVLPENFDTLLEQARAAEAKRIAEQAERTKRQREEQQKKAREALAQWRRGEIDWLPYNHLLDGDCLRFTRDGQTITSCSGYDKSQMNGLEKKKVCISKLLIATDGHVSADEVLVDYMANWEPTTLGDTRRDEKKRKSVIRSLFKKMRKGFRPKSDQRKYPFKQNQFTEIIKGLNIPADEFRWDRREKIDVQRLSDFVSMKVADAFYKGKKDGWFAMTKRDTTVENSRKLKAKGTERGGINWTLNNSTYRKLLEIATKYKLLEVFEDYQMPIRDSRTKRKLTDGTPRLIGPGEALKAVQSEWLPLYEKWKASDKKVTLKTA